MLSEQNQWLNGKVLVLNRSYTINLQNREYKNIILECDIDTQKEFVKRQVIIVGFQERRCFECVNTMQCLNCFRYGHLQSDCNFPVTCKKCSGTHARIECEVLFTCSLVPFFGVTNPRKWFPGCAKIVMFSTGLKTYLVLIC